MSKSKITSRSAKTAPSGAATTLVYCGPTIPRVCTKYAMFSTIPDALNKKAEELPLIRELIVPITAFAEVRVKIESGTGAIFGIYQEVQKKL